jgi:transitional endoplasmic reticulum ATPase
MNEVTLKLLEKALLASPDDWETRAHVIDQYLAAGKAQRAAELLKSAANIPESEDASLLKARIELETAPNNAQATLQYILARNKGCARAYHLLAKLYQKRGLREEARKKYGAATVIDESLSDPELEAWLDGTTTTPSKPASSGPALPPIPPPTPKPPKPVSTSPSPDEIEEGDELDESGKPGVPVSATDIANALNALNEPAAAERPKITFKDIGGMEEVIERIRMNIIYPFKNPEIFRKFNKRPGGGILMYGPPGCGKTHIARATAGECGAVFIPIAITDILSKWLGESERHLHEFFETARRRSPAVIFIDEIDAIGVSRGDAGASMAPIVNVLLTEMDGISASNENLMVLAATNTPWRVDSALRRPGRFDRVLFVPPPDAPARKAIFNICLRDLPADSIDVEKLARAADRFSGADIRAAVQNASEKAIMEEMRTGRSGKLTQGLLADAVKETRASTGEWLETAKSYATYANRTGLYDDLVAFFEKY